MKTDHCLSEHLLVFFSGLVLTGFCLEPIAAIAAPLQDNTVELTVTPTEPCRAGLLPPSCVDVSVIDRVSGTASGTLTLIQNAIGGGGEFEGVRPAPGFGLSSLNVDVAEETTKPAVLTIETAGTGGSASGGESFSVPGQAGGDGSATSKATHDAGASNAIAHAWGGDGGVGIPSSGIDAGRGGNAEAAATASVMGTGHDASARGRAEAGVGGDAFFSFYSGVGGHGGDAISRSRAVSKGDSRIDVGDYAKGGAGGGLGPAAIVASGGAGGSADSRAEANQSGGVGIIQLATTAEGGTGGAGRGRGEHGGRGGSAESFAETSSASSGNGQNTQVRGVASGGVGGDFGGGFDGGFDGGDGGDGGAASAGVRSRHIGVGVGTLDIAVEARGGFGGSGQGLGGHGGDGGGATLMVAMGNANDNTRIAVSAIQAGGNGGVGIGGAAGGKGANSSVVDSVHGASQGEVVLTQTAKGGNGGLIIDPPVFGSSWLPSLGLPGAGGTANSILTTSNDGGGDITADTLAYGGSGGLPGDANAVTNLVGRQRVFAGATAVGGMGGGVLESETGSGWSGGAASARATASQSQDGIGAVSAESSAEGGAGGAGRGEGERGGKGGDAESFSAALLASGGDGQDMRVSSVAVGGAGGSGGDRVEDVGRWFRGGVKGSGGDGGVAHAGIAGSHVGPDAGALDISAVARGGPGGSGRGLGERGGDGGIASVSDITGIADGATPVAVSATLIGGDGGTRYGTNLRYERGKAGDGADSILVDKVSGDTAGDLELRQTARAGRGGLIELSSEFGAGFGEDGHGGRAVSSFSATSENTGYLFGISQAFGGAGATGGDAAAAIELVGRENVTATAIATGGGQSDAVVALGVGDRGVSGISTGGGTVTVTGVVDGGSGNGFGNNATVIDAVTGATSGILILNQNAHGASGGKGSSFLSHDVSGESVKPRVLEVNVEGVGGVGVGYFGSGANGTAVGNAVNVAGASKVSAHAEGGRGSEGDHFRGVSVGGDGGLARSEASAFAQSEEAVAIGFAKGGDGGYSDSSGSDGGRGGDALGRSTASLTGAGMVMVTDHAVGGDGGAVLRGYDGRLGGVGGMADSRASGNLEGVGSIDVSARADGGSGGTSASWGEVHDGFDPEGGSANAVAMAMGGSRTSVRAEANGGTGGVWEHSIGIHGGGGNAIADATGTNGQSIASLAIATAGRGYVWGQVQHLSTRADAAAFTGESLASGAHAEALRHGPGFDPGTATGHQAASLAYATPDAGVSLPLLNGNPVLANFDIAGQSGAATLTDSTQLDSDILAVGVLGGRYAVNADGGRVTTQSQAELSVDTNALQAGAQHLLLGFMNPVVDDSAFDDPDFSVRFRVEREGAALVDQTFTDAASAHAYFDGVTHDLGAIAEGVSGDLDLALSLDVSADRSDAGIAIDYVLGNSTLTPRAVPVVLEPGIDIDGAHVGDDLTAAIRVRNAAVAGSDGADATIAATSPGVTPTSTVGISGLAPGATDDSTLGVSIDTTAAGERNASVTVQLASDGTVTGHPEAFGSTEVRVTGTVYDYARPAFALIDGEGTLTGGGADYQLDLGNLPQGSIGSATLAVLNDLTGVAVDSLDGHFDLAAAGPFGANGFDPFFGLGGGEASGDLLLGLDTSGLGLGLIEGDIVLLAEGHNSGGYRQGFAPITLTLRAHLVDRVPLPGTLLLLLLGLVVRRWVLTAESHPDPSGSAPDADSACGSVARFPRGGLCFSPSGG